MAPQCDISFSRPSDDSLLITFMGACRIGGDLPSISSVQSQITSGKPVQRITFNTGNLTDWDSGFLTFLVKIFDLCTRENITVDRDGLPEGIHKLLSLASSTSERKVMQREKERFHVYQSIGSATIDFGRSFNEVLRFIGEAFVALCRLISGRARFRWSDFFVIVQESGAQALPIVSLISLLVGLILAFIGAIQLRMFGAQIYVADLVGIGIVREMGAIMTGIIMAGRTGAAFAAQLGTMQVNEEIDALTTLGISPMEFLVLPRMLALFLMMPLLTIYADMMGVLGGLLVGTGMLDLGFMEYYNETLSTVRLTDFWIGIFMGAVFGILVSLSGCLRGIQCGRSASEVGKATTSAVVTGIVSIVVATAIINIICTVLNI
jgi:phospholipid/cholesterol/gamma-HCH transport system permease protein